LDWNNCGGICGVSAAPLQNPSNLKRFLFDLNPICQLRPFLDFEAAQSGGLIKGK